MLIERQWYLLWHANWDGTGDKRGELQVRLTLDNTANPNCAGPFDLSFDFCKSALMLLIDGWYVHSLFPIPSRPG